MNDFDIKYPDIEITLSGEDGNAFAILARVVTAMRKAKLDKDQIDEYITEAMSGDYDNLIATTCRYVNVS